MSQRGNHTWDMVITYHLCPECGYINESRQKYEYLNGRYQKEAQCSRCHHAFTAVQPGTPSLGPILGDPQPVETEWGDTR